MDASESPCDETHNDGKVTSEVSSLKDIALEQTDGPLDLVLTGEDFTKSCDHKKINDSDERQKTTASSFHDDEETDKASIEENTKGEVDESDKLFVENSHLSSSISDITILTDEKGFESDPDTISHKTSDSDGTPSSKLKLVSENEYIVDGSVDLGDIIESTNGLECVNSLPLVSEFKGCIDSSNERPIISKVQPQVSGGSIQTSPNEEQMFVDCSQNVSLGHVSIISCSQRNNEENCKREKSDRTSNATLSTRHDKTNQESKEELERNKTNITLEDASSIDIEHTNCFDSEDDSYVNAYDSALKEAQSLAFHSEKVDSAKEDAMDSMDVGLRRRGIHDPKHKNQDNLESSMVFTEDASERTKIKSVLAVLRSDNPDRESLKQLAISRGGLVNNELRKLAWPKLLGVDVTNISEKPDQDTLKAHRDYEQVVLDVNRSLKRFPPGMEESVRMSMQDQLVDCIMRVLCAQPELHYYQGYHDIVVTFLLVAGEDLTFVLMNELSMRHLRDFMYENMDKTTGMLHYLYPLLGKSNPKLRQFMEKAEVGTIFALAWLITWFGHVLGDIRHIVRLYDFFIACHPLMPIYLAAAIVLYRSEEILCCEPEMPIIHSLLSKIPPDLPIEKLISEAGDLYLVHPPDSIEKEAKAQYQLYIEENERKRDQLKQLQRARAARGHKRSHSWWSGYRRTGSGDAGSGKSVLVKVTVWTSAAILSAAAVSFYWSKVNSGGDALLDFNWLWGS